MDQETYKALVERMRELATYLAGEPNKSLSSKKELRFGNKGSVSVAVAGRNAGAWYDHEIQEGGGPLELIQRYVGCDRHGAYEFAEQWLGAPAFLAPLRPKTAPESTSYAEDEAERIGRALRIWDEAVPPQNTLVEKYLRKRGLELPPNPDAVLRYYGADPMMVALLRNIRTDKPCGIIRTWLNQDATRGKKWMLGRAEGAAVKLTPDEDVTHGLGIAEGVETALAAMQRYSFAPMWACGSSGGIAQFPQLAGIEYLTIFVDNDRRAAGRKAADACAARWAPSGAEVELNITHLVGTDVADLVEEDADE